MKRDSSAYPYEMTRSNNNEKLYTFVVNDELSVRS